MYLRISTSSQPAENTQVRPSGNKAAKLRKVTLARAGGIAGRRTEERGQKNTRRQKNHTLGWVIMEEMWSGWSDCLVQPEVGRKLGAGIAVQLSDFTRIRVLLGFCGLRT